MSHEQFGDADFSSKFNNEEDDDEGLEIAISDAGDEEESSPGDHPPKLDPRGSSSWRENDEANTDDMEVVTTAPTSSYAHRVSKRYFRLSLLSNFFFVVGSVLYVWMAVDDWQFAKGLATDTAGVPNYDDYYFDQLPPRQQECAQALGYDQLLWDTGGEAEESDEWWADLTPEQQEAAECLGYTQEFWDGYEDYIAAAEGEEEGTADASPGIGDGDYVFRVPLGSRYANVSRYMIQYFVAASCFVVVGLVDLIRERRWLVIFPWLMMAAGLFGAISAMLVERNIRTSNIFNLLSAHFYFLEAISMACHHRSKMHPTASFWTAFTPWLGFADVCFAVGTLIEVVLSYFYVLDVYADFNTSIAGADVAAQSLWVVCSTIYIITTYLEYTRTKRSCEKRMVMGKIEEKTTLPLDDTV